MARHYIRELLGENVTCIIDDGVFDIHRAAIDHDMFLRDFQEMTDIVIVTAQSAKSEYEILDILDKSTVRDIAVFNPSVYRFKKGIGCNFRKKRSLVWYRKDKKTYPIIPRLELNLIDGCNLNCKACSHFSSIFSANSVYPLDEYIEALKQLRKLGSYVRLRLLGGEPLLVDNLDQYLYETRALFDEADIEIVTNGLLLDRVRDDILKAIHETDSYITISLYPPTQKSLK